MMLLIDAVKRERLSQICYFLKAGIDVNLQDVNGQTALIHCCFVRHPQKRLYILRLLLNNQVDANKKDKYGRSAISWLCLLGLGDLFNALVHEYYGLVDLQTVDNDGNTLILLAVTSRSRCMIELVLKTLAKYGLLYQVSLFNKKGLCPLLVAFYRKDKASADLLMKYGRANVSNVLKNLKRIDYAHYDHILPERGQAFFTKLRAIQRDDNDYKLQPPNEQDFLQFLYCSPEDLCYQGNDISSFGNPRLTGSNSSTPWCTSGSTTIKRTREPGKKCLQTTPENFCCQGRDATRTLQYASIHANALLKTTPNACTSSMNTVTDTSRANDKRMAPNSFKNLYDIYSSQLSCSYRPSSVKALTLPLPSEEEAVTPPRRRSLHQRSSNVSQSSTKTLSKRSSCTSSVTLTVQESAYDRQMRMNYSRSTRASSVQVKSTSRLSTKMKRSRSSTFSPVNCPMVLEHLRLYND